MTRPLVVTGYIDLNSSYRTDAVYRQLGKQLKDAVLDLMAFEDTHLSECWLMRHIPEDDADGNSSYTSAIADNPYKNTPQYHIVQHQKVDWMRQASNAHPDRDVLIWVDYAIFHMPGVTAAVIQNFIERAADEQAISIPGCWPPNRQGEPNWRFCGSVLVSHRKQIPALDAAIKRTAIERLKKTRHITFEVNTWADVERKKLLPIRWYRADHNASLFTDY